MTLTTQRGGTILDHLHDGLALGLPSTVRVQGSGPLVPVGLDNGNGHTKLALITPTGELVTQAAERQACPVRGRLDVPPDGGFRAPTHCSQRINLHNGDAGRVQRPASLRCCVSLAWLLIASCGLHRFVRFLQESR